MLSTVSACFDESGKFSSHGVVSIGCVGGYSERFESGFSHEWEILLNRYGIRVFSGKDFLNHNRPLSEKNPCLGVDARTDALLAFVACIRKHLQVIVGMATDTKAFKELPPHFFRVFGNNPSFMTFVRNMMHIAEFTPDRSKIFMFCDDDEETALHFYRLYRRVKKVWPECRRKLGGIAFVDDRYMFGVQASDLVASLIRLEAESQIVGTKYDYSRVHGALIAKPERHESYLYNIAIGIGDRKGMLKIAEEMKDEYDKAAKENAEEQQAKRSRKK